MLTRQEWVQLTEALGQPFPEEAVYWRAGSVSRDKSKAQALPYAESRVYEDRLNALCPGAWSVTFKPWGDSRLICELSVHGVMRASTGEENEGFAPGTAAEAQAFKRACSKFGLGRYLYDLPIPWVAYDADRRRLVDTPSLPKQFLPEPEPVFQASTGRLSDRRALAMELELQKVGLAADAQLAFAAEHLGRKVKALTELSESEALSVWQEAKRSQKRAA